MTEEENEFIGEFEEMDLTELMSETFMVAMSKGPRDEAQFLCTTLAGPFDFYEMVETVGAVYEQHQCHAKAMIVSSEFGTPPKILDENTIDFIEAQHQDIIMDGMLGGELTQEKEFTCKAGFIAEEKEDKDGQDDSEGKD